MNSKDDTLAQTSTVAGPSLVADEQISHQEVSHVFYCMQCDLQFQMDIAVTSRNELHELDAGVARVRLNPRIRLERGEELQ
jgi:hypothetical protein